MSAAIRATDGAVVLDAVLAVAVQSLEHTFTAVNGCRTCHWAVAVALSWAAVEQPWHPCACDGNIGVPHAQAAVSERTS
jgi:hypothetical protein